MVGWAADSKVQSGGFSAGRQIGSIPLIFHKRCFPLCTLYSYKHVNQTKASTSFLVFSQPVTKRRKYKRKLQVFDRQRQILLTEQVKCYMSCLRPSVSFLNDISAFFETDPDYLYKETIF